MAFNRGYRRNDGFLPFERVPCKYSPSLKHKLPPKEISICTSSNTSESTEWLETSCESSIETMRKDSKCDQETRGITGSKLTSPIIPFKTLRLRKKLEKGITGIPFESSESPELLWPATTVLPDDPMLEDSDWQTMKFENVLCSTPRRISKLTETLYFPTLPGDLSPILPISVNAKNPTLLRKASEATAELHAEGTSEASAVLRAENTLPAVALLNGNNTPISTAVQPPKLCLPQNNKSGKKEAPAFKSNLVSKPSISEEPFPVHKDKDYPYKNHKHKYKENARSEFLHDESIQKETVNEKSMHKESNYADSAHEESLQGKYTHKQFIQHESLIPEAVIQESVVQESVSPDSVPEESVSQDSVSEESVHQYYLDEEPLPKEPLVKDPVPKEPFPRGSLLQELVNLKMPFEVSLLNESQVSIQPFIHQKYTKRTYSMYPSSKEHTKFPATISHCLALKPTPSQLDLRMCSNIPSTKTKVITKPKVKRHSNIPKCNLANLPCLRKGPDLFLGGKISLEHNWLEKLPKCKLHDLPLVKYTI